MHPGWIGTTPRGEPGRWEILGVARRFRHGKGAKCDGGGVAAGEGNPSATMRLFSR